MEKPKYWIFIVFGLIVIWLTALVHKCEHKPKPKTYVNFAIRDSIIKVVEYRDSIRTQTITKWRTVKVKPDSIPCDTFLQTVIQFCDTIISVDSAQIASLKGLVKQDSIIITGLVKRVNEDSIELMTVTKKLKRQKLYTKLSFGAGLLSGGFLISQLK
jgi:hypothetical protein